MDHHILTVALRILNAYALQIAPDPADVEILKKAVTQMEARQSPDTLAVHIVERELRKQRERDREPK